MGIVRPREQIIRRGRTTRHRTLTALVVGVALTTAGLTVNQAPATAVTARDPSAPVPRLESPPQEEPQPALQKPGVAWSASDPQPDAKSRDERKPIREMPHLRNERTRVFDEGGGYIRFQEYQTPIHYRQDNGWVPIENTLVEDTAQPDAVRTAQNAWTASFAPSPRGVTLITPDGLLTTTAVRASDDAAARRPDVVKSPQHKESTIEEQAATSAVPESAIVDYWRIWHDVDVRYEVRGDALKEDIRLLSSDARSDYAFDIIGADVSADGDGLKLGGPLGRWFRIAPPTITAADGSDVTQASGVHYELREAPPGKDARIAVVLDDDWLADQPAGAFPLTIDPDYVSIQQAPTTSAVTLTSAGSTSGSTITIGTATGSSTVRRGGVSFSAYNTYMSAYKVFHADLFFNRTDSNAQQIDVDVYDQGSSQPAFADVGPPASAPFAGTKYECAGSPAPAGKSCLPAEVTDTLRGWFDQNISSGWFGIRSRQEGAGTQHIYQVFLDAELYYPPKPSRVTNLTTDQVLATTTPTLRAQGIPRALNQTTSSGDPAYLFEITTGPNPGTGLVIGSGYLFCGPFVDTSPSGEAPFDPSLCQWAVPKGALHDGMTYYAWVITNWTGGTPYLGSSPTIPPASYGVKFKVDLGLGNGGHFPTDEVGAVPGSASSPSEGAPNPSLPPSKTTVNLVDGNAAITVETPKLESVSGGIQLRFAYNSLAAAGQGLQGLSAEYFNDKNNNGVIDAGTDTLVATRTDATAFFDWGTSPGVGGQDLDRALARWTGSLTLPSAISGHTFNVGATSSDGVRVSVGGVQRLDDWGPHSPQKAATFGTSTFSGSGTKSITIDWHHASQNPAVVKVFLKDMSACSNGVCDIYALDPSWLTRSTRLLPAGWNMNSAAASARWVSVADHGDSVTVYADDGSGHVFTKNSGGRYTPPTEAPNDLLTVDDSGQFVLASGTYNYTFGPTGALLGVASTEDDQHPAALQYSFSGTPTLLRTITDPVRCAGASPCPVSSQVTLSYGDDSGAPAACAGAPTGLLCNIAYWDGSATSLYYSNGRLSQIANPGSVFYDFEYDTLGRVTKVRDPLAHQAVAATVRADDDTTKTLIAYDSSADSGRVSTIEQPAPTAGASRPKRLYCYGNAKAYSGSTPSCNTPAANTTSVAVYGFSPSVGYAYQEIYDSRNRRISSRDSAGLETRYVWDDKDRQIAKIDPAGIETSTEYDVLGHATKAYGPAPSTSFAPDGKPNPTPGVPTTTKDYDEGTSGLSASWYDGTDVAGAAKFHSTSSLSDSWSGGCNSPSSCNGGGSLIGPSNFSGLLNGSVKLPSSGRITLDANGGRVFTDDHLVVDQLDGPYASAVRSDRPVGWWRLSETGSSTTAGDEAGSNAGTYAGSVTRGQTGPHAGDTHTAAAFDGSTGTVSIPDSRALRFQYTEPFSVDLWLKTSTVSTSSRALVSKLSTGGAGWEIGLNATSQPYFTLANDNLNFIAKNSSIPIASNGSWRHIAVTYSGSGLASGVSFYVDGAVDAVPVTTKDTLFSSSTTSSAPVAIGSRGGSSLFFPGTIADVAVYEKQLASTEVSAHRSASALASQATSSPIIYNTSYPGAVADDGPASYWRLSETSGTTATDSGGSSNGTYSAGVTLNQTGPVPGDPSKSALFNGTTGTVSVADSPKHRFNQRQGFAVEMWLKTSCSCPAIQALVSKMANAAPFQGWEVALHTNGQPYFQLINDFASDNRIYAKGVTRLADGAWHHLAVTYDGSSTAQGVEFFVDGRNDDKTIINNSLTKTPVSSAPLYVGSRANGAYWWSGMLSDVAVYPRPLQSAATSAHHLAGRTHYPKAVASDSPISYWRLGETVQSTSPASDLAGTNPATYTSSGCTHTSSGPINGDGSGAATFNGSTCALTAPDSPSAKFERTQAFSVDGWVKTSSTAQQAIAAKMNNATPFRGWNVILNAGKLQFQLISTWSTNAISVQGATNLANGAWHHVAATYDGSSQASGVDLYVDGVRETATTLVDSLSGETRDQTQLSIAARTGGLFYSGSIGELAVYSRELSADQVKSHNDLGLKVPASPETTHRIAVLDQQFVTGGHLSVTTNVGGATFSPNYGHLTTTATSPRSRTPTGTSRKRVTRTARTASIRSSDCRRA
jgi:YD repeat-containing protein